MTIRPSIDVATRVSPALSAVIDRLVNDPDREQPPQTLAEVRGVLLERSARVGNRDIEYLHPQEDSSLLVELDRLIEEYGRDAAAVDFVAARASEGLSRLIQAALDDISFPRAPTLGGLRKAMLSGLTARLIGAGALDEDDEGVLLGEIDELIRRYGEDQPAEFLIRFE